MRKLWGAARKGLGIAGFWFAGRRLGVLGFCQEVFQGVEFGGPEFSVLFRPVGDLFQGLEAGFAMTLPPVGGDRD